MKDDNVAENIIVSDRIRDLDIRGRSIETLLEQQGKLELEVELKKHLSLLKTNLHGIYLGSVRVKVEEHENSVVIELYQLEDAIRERLMEVLLPSKIDELRTKFLSDLANATSLLQNLLNAGGQE